jgi:RNase P subunit RPR2
MSHDAIMERGDIVDDDVDTKPTTCADCGKIIHVGDRVTYRPSIEEPDGFVSTCAACHAIQPPRKRAFPWNRPGRKCHDCGKRIKTGKNEIMYFREMYDYPGIHYRVCNDCARKKY